MKKIYRILTISLFFLANHAMATIYEYESTNLNGVVSSYRFDTGTNVFDLSFDFNQAKGVDGFWFVVNDGPQPLFTDQGDYAIFYSDFSDIWAYQYTGWGHGTNGSYTGSLLQKWDNSVSLSESSGIWTTELQLDLSALNALNFNGVNWKGLAFDDTIGTWMHPTRNTFNNCGGSYENNGDLTCFTSNNYLGWDEKNKQTTAVFNAANLAIAVPEPGTVMLFTLGILGLTALRRRRIKEDEESKLKLMTMS